MMERSHLEGTIWHQIALSEEGTDKAILLVKFIGEGSRQVVYDQSSVNRSQIGEYVLKISKPQAFLEMSTLNYQFSIHPDWARAHPLQMLPEERMERLCAEMFKLASGIFVRHRCEEFRHATKTVITSIGCEFGDQFNDGSLEEDFLCQIGDAWRELDEYFVASLNEMLDRDEIVEEYRQFFEMLAETAPHFVNDKRAKTGDDVYSANLHHNIFGLYLAKFINRDEMLRLLTHGLEQGFARRTARRTARELYAVLWKMFHLYDNQLQRWRRLSAPTEEMILGTMDETRSFMLDPSEDTRMDPARIMSAEEFRKMAIESIEVHSALTKDSAIRIFRALWAGAMMLQVVGREVDAENAAEYEAFVASVKALAAG
jgi:hypothetical protein